MFIRFRREDGGDRVRSPARQQRTRMTTNVGGNDHKRSEHLDVEPEHQAWSAGQPSAGAPY
jgi:hypothetical protein